MYSEVDGSPIDTSDPVFFYENSGKYGPFSNYSRHAFVIDGVEWPTSEHYFQALKFHGNPYVEEVRAAPHPDKAKQMGQTRAVPLRADWESVKEKVMLDALEAKFSQHAELKQLLLSTGNRLIVERTQNDSYWGDGGDYSGKNRLGYCLMQVRNKLASQ